MLNRQEIQSIGCSSRFSDLDSAIDRVMEHAKRLGSSRKVAKATEQMLADGRQRQSVPYERALVTLGELLSLTVRVQ